MNDTTTIYIIRHGESEANVAQEQGIMLEQRDSEIKLTSLGHEQAKIRAKELKNVPFSTIYSSDFLRARATGEIIALEHKLAVETRQAIGERSFGNTIRKLSKEEFTILESRIMDDLEKLDDKGKLFYKVKEHSDVETPGDAMMRLFTFLREIAITHKGQTVAVINHGDIMRSLLVHLGWATYDELPMRTIANTAYIVLESDGIEFSVKQTVGIEKKHGVRRGL